MENQFGTVSITKEVLARVAGYAAMECYGIVGMAAKSVTDDIFKLLKFDNLTRGINIEKQDNIIDIELHIIVLYGTKITEICNTIISTVKYKVEESTGLKVGKIDVIVEGVKVDK